MTLFSNDSDLLVHEPRVFHELPFASQTLVRVDDAAVNGNAVTTSQSAFGDLAPGDVMVIGEGAYTVLLSQGSGSVLLTQDVVDGASSTVYVRTLAPQAELVHAELMRAIELDADDPENEHDESAVLSLELMREVEAIGTLARAYAAAITLGDSQAIEAKAQRYHLKFREALHNARVRLDLTGDGRADVVRALGVSRMIRA